TEPTPLAPPLAQPESGGSDDIGDVSWVVPTAPLFYPSNIPNLPGHHWANAMAMATPIAHKGNLAGSEVMGIEPGRVAVPSAAGRGAEDLFHRCSAQAAPAAVATRRARPAAGPDQSGYNGALPPGDAQVLLRRHQVRHLSRSARRQVSAADQAAVGWPT